MSETNGRDARDGPDRRRFLKAIGALGVAGAAGCLGDGADTDTPTAGTTPSTTADDATPTDTATPVPRDVSILVVSATPDYRHESIPAGNRALQDLGDRLAGETGIGDVVVDIVDSEGEHADTEPTAFPTDAEELAAYDVLVFNNANGGTPPDEGPDVFDDDQAAAFEAFVRSGGGVVGIHSAIDAQRADSFYAEVMGSYFANHPATQEGTIAVTDRVHPSTIDVAADGQVFYVDRGDYRENDTERIMAVDPDTGETTTVLELEVYGTNNGIKGMVLEPDFEGEGYMYLNYAPPSAEIDEPHNRISRFGVADGNSTADSEVEILRLPIQREIIGHRAGNLAWGPDGEHLYAAVGDDTYCCETQYAPIDERDGRAVYDAQRTSANTADLRGSILRIAPNDDGSYEVPGDNLFTEEGGYAAEIEQGLVRPEIYVMGLRNPYRMAIDAATGALHWGDYGPDASEWDSRRGPPGVVEYDRATEAGFHGWPLIVGDNVPYRHHDFETGESGRIFDPEGPTNDSVNNDGLVDLPATTGAMITSPRNWSAYLDYPAEWDEYVPYDSIHDVPFPQVSGASPMQGPVYRGSGDGDGALPAYYDGKAFIMERNANWIKYVSLDDDGEAYEVDPFLPGETVRRPMDMTTGPEGALYVIEWGSSWDAPNEDSGIYRIEHDPGA